MSATGISGLEQLRILLGADLRPMGIAQALQIDLVEVEEGRAVFAGTPGAHVCRPQGLVHAGYAATLLESAIGCAVHSLLGAGQGCTTLELKIAYHRALTPATGRVRAEGKVVSMGKRVAFAEGRILDAGGTLYASASSTLLLLEQRAGAFEPP
ncbi:MAG TPA: PaaI family thioesterase [Nevskia sp.]|nr:PaaI family thioesterase [Nevskia sp.]